MSELQNSVYAPQKRAAGALRALSKNEKIFFSLALVLYFCACSFLYYKQALGTAWDDTYAYVSDLPIQMGEAFSGFGGRQYSLNSVVFYLLHLIFPRNPAPIALYLAAVTAATVPVTGVVIQKLAPGAPSRQLLVLSWLLHFCMSLYIPGLGLLRYIGTFSGALWHNHTYIVMRFLALLSLGALLDWRAADNCKDQAKPLLLFLLFFTLTTWAKPSFYISAVPAFGILMLARLIRQKGAGFWRLFRLGCCFLPGLVIALLQSSSMFGDGRLGFVLGVSGYFAMPLWRTLLLLFRALLFPALVFIMLRRDTKKELSLPFVLLNFLFAVTELTLLTEVGERASHYNMIWGVHFATFLLFLQAAVVLLKVAPAAPKRSAKNAILFATLSLHALCGVIYFVMLLFGFQYSAI